MISGTSRPLTPRISAMSSFFSSFFSKKQTCGERLASLAGYIRDEGQSIKRFIEEWPGSQVEAIRLSFSREHLILYTAKITAHVYEKDSKARTRIIEDCYRTYFKGIRVPTEKVPLYCCVICEDEADYVAREFRLTPAPYEKLMDSLVDMKETMVLLTERRIMEYASVMGTVRARFSGDVSPRFPLCRIFLWRVRGGSIEDVSEAEILNLAIVLANIETCMLSEGERLWP